MKEDSIQNSARDLLAGIYKQHNGINFYVGLDYVKKFLPRHTLPVESHLITLADAGLIRISSDGAYISLTHAGKCYCEGVCASCGYDMRATLTRCPECGTLAAEI